MAGKDSILRIILEVTKKGDGDKAAYKDLQNLNTVLKETTGINLNSITAWSLVGAAITGVVAIGKKVVDYFKEGTQKLLAYNEAAENFSRLSGMNVRQSQAMVVMAQRLNVDQTALANSMFFLAKKGIEPTNEQLVKMAADYVAIQNPADQAKWLTDNFSKSGKDLFKVFEQGGPALKALLADIAQYNSLTATTLRQTGELEKAQNELTAAQDTQQMLWAAKTLPMQIAIVEMQTQIIKKRNDEMITLDRLKEFETQGVISKEKYNELTKLNIKSEDAWKTSSYSLIGAINEVTNANDKFGITGNRTLVVTNDLAEADKYLDEVFGQTAANISKGWSRVGNDFYDANGKIIESLGMSTRAIDELNKANENHLTALGNWSQSERTFTQERTDHYSKLSILEEEYNKKISQGYWARGKTMTDLQGKIDDEKAAIADLEAAHERETKSVILGYIQQNLAADGILTDEETAWLVAKGVEWGIYDKTAVESLKNVQREAKNLADELNGIPLSKQSDVFIVTHRITTYSEEIKSFMQSRLPVGYVNGQKVINTDYDLGIGDTQASGGLLADTAIVGEKGYEAIVKDRNGKHIVIPHDMTAWLLSQGLLGVNGSYGMGGPVILPDQVDTVINYAQPKTSNSYSRGDVIPSGSGRVGTGVGGGGTGSSRGTPPGGISAGTAAAAAAAAASQAAGQIAAETVAPVVGAAMQNFQAAQQQNSAQVAQQTASAQQNSAELIGEIRQMKNAIQRIPEQLAAQIQKYRK